MRAGLYILIPFVSKGDQEEALKAVIDERNFLVSDVIEIKGKTMIVNINSNLFSNALALEYWLSCVFLGFEF